MLYDSLVWFNGVPGGPACQRPRTPRQKPGSAAGLGSPEAVWYPHAIPHSDSVLWPRPVHWCPTMGTFHLPPRPLLPQRDRWLFLVKPGPPSLSWLTLEPPRRLLTPSTPSLRDPLLEHDTPWNPIAPPGGGALLNSLTPLPSLHPRSPAGLLVLPRLAPASGQCLSGSA